MGSSRSRHAPELDRARKVQLGMLPQIPSLSGLEIACSYRACDELGGDFYDFITVDPWRFGIVIADVSGHGTAAALLMAAAKKVLQICGRGSLSPVQTILEVNDSIRADIPPGMFFTVFYGIVDIRNLQMTFVSCGHNPPLLRRGGEVRNKWELKNAPPIGVLPSEALKDTLDTGFVQLQGDDVLLLYTDGLPEAFDAQRTMYGEERLGRVLLDAGGGSAQDVIDRITADLDSFRGDNHRSDDETVVAIRATPRLGRVEPLMPVTGVQSEAPTEPPGELIGREKELAALARKLESGSAPVLTITGPLGSGKSRVAARVVEMTRGRFGGGVHFADLQSARTTGDVCRMVATSLGLGTEQSELGLRIARSFQGAGGRVLLVLDNCEDCAEPVATCIRHWNANCPQLSILNTSRRPIDVHDESVHALKPLRTPRPSSGRLTPVKAQSFPSVKLFVNAARSVNDSFELTDQNADDIIEICERLDGLPQAIEMAAARIGSMTPRQILKRLDERSDISSDRHKPLADALEWSFGLLSERERQALILLSSFPDGFQLEVAVSMLKDIPDIAPEDLVLGLVKHSMVFSDTPPELGGEKRFFLYHAVRKFALELLHDTPAMNQVRERFETVLLTYVRKWWDEDNRRSDPGARRRVNFELEGLLEIAGQTGNSQHRAWATIMGAERLNAVGEVDRSVDLLRRAQEGIEPGSDEWTWIRILDGKLRVRTAPENVLDLLEEISANEQQNYAIATVRAVAHAQLGHIEKAIELHRKAEKLAQGDNAKRARAKERIAMYMVDTGHPQQALEGLEHALRLAREHGDPSVEALILRDLGLFYTRSADAEKSVRYLKEALRISQQDGDRMLEASILGSLALSTHLSGERQQAEALILRGLRISREIGVWGTTTAHLNTLARMYYEQDRLEDAVKATIKSRDISRELGLKRSEGYAESNLGSLLTMLGRHEQALKSLENAYAILKELKDRRGQSAALANIGEWYGARWKKSKQKRDLLKAIEMVEKACEMRRQGGFDPALESEIELAEYLLAAGKRKQAHKWAERAVETGRAKKDDHGRKMLKKAEALLESLSPAKPKRARTVAAPPPAKKSGASIQPRQPRGKPGAAPRKRNRRSP